MRRNGQVKIKQKMRDGITRKSDGKMLQKQNKERIFICFTRHGALKLEK